jgi:lysophospholipase L1-like esterase
MTERNGRLRWSEHLLSAVGGAVLVYGMVALFRLRSEPGGLLSIDAYWRNNWITIAFGAVWIAAAFIGWRRGSRMVGVRLLMGILALMLAAADAYVLAYRFDTSGPGGGLNLTNGRWMETYLGKVRPDPHGREFLNEAKFWERSLAPYYELGPEDRFLIAAVGDSFTFGQGVLNRDHRFTERLQARLQTSHGKNVEVLNFGWGNGDTKTETTWIRDAVVKVKPDVVAIFYLANDIEDLAFFTAPPGYAIGKTETALLIASPAFNLAYWRLAGPWIYAGMGNAYFHNLLMSYVNEERFQKHLADINRQVETVRSIGAAPIFVILPFPHLWQGVDKAWQAKIYARIAAAAESQSALVLNLASIEDEITPEAFQVNPIDGHPNAAAHDLIAQRVYDWLSKLPLVPRMGASGGSGNSGQ